ncbi:MAG: DUF6132 family protein [Bacteroidota bacterium]
MVRIGAVALGAVLGYAFYKFVGCRTGACPITSNPWMSTLYGAVLGGLAAWR